ncbi:MAG: SRPBCC family protein [Frankiales bacterium]|nr:SRPBCC family protein [Frankiales bacterium]
MVNGVATYEVTASSAAPPEQVFALVADGAGWSKWAGPMVPGSSWEREGNPAPGGVGAIRRLGLGPVGSREEIVAYEPPRHLAYCWHTRVVRDYRSDVRLEPDGAGTRIVWSGTFRSGLLPAGLMQRFFTRTVGGFAQRLAREAERSHRH